MASGPQLAASKQAFGYFCLLGLIVTWIAQSEVVQFLQTGSKTDYNKPLFITWCNHSWGVLLIPVQWIHFRLRIRPGLVDRPATVGNGVTDSLPLKSTASIGWFSYLQEYHGINLATLLVHCSWLSVVFLLGDYFWYIGLAYTSVAVGTTIFNSCCVFTYLFSVLFGLEKLVLVKVLAVGLALGGVAVVSFCSHTASDKTGISNVDAIAGNLFVLLAAVGYGLYEVLLKRYPLRSGEVVDSAVVNTITGLISLLNMLFLWVLILLVQYLPGGYFNEQFVFPRGRTLMFLVVNGLLALAFNIFLMLSVALTSPLTVSVGCMLTIPISGLTDYVLHHTNFPPLAFVGSVLVFAGFGWLSYIDAKESSNSGDGTDEDLADEVTRHVHLESSPESASSSEEPLLPKHE